MQETIEKLKSIRKEFGLSQKDIAKEIGVTTRAVLFWESGKRGITLQNAEKYAAAMGHTLILIKK